MFKFVKAEAKDTKLLLEWRNDPSAYENFFVSESVTWPKHVDWLNKVLLDENRYLFLIFNEENKPIGQVRFDIEDKEAEISITIAKEFRSQGYGKQTIYDSSKMFLEMNPNLDRVVAKILDRNPKSVATFIKAGYHEVRKEEKVIVLEFTM